MTQTNQNKLEREVLNIDSFSDAKEAIKQGKSFLNLISAPGTCVHRFRGKEDYEDIKSGKKRPELKRIEKHEHTHGEKCYCPYCDIEIEEDITFCEACQSDLNEHH